MRQHLCVVHALPRTRLTNAILYENSSQERHLEMKLTELQRRKLRSSVAMEITKRAFTAQQDRKRRKWQREDQVRISSMNLPVFTERGQREMSGIGGGVGLVADRRPSMMTIYRLASDGGRAESTVQDRKPLLPMMKIKRERTEIISHHDRVFVTKLPSVVEVDQRLLTIHNEYCGQTLLSQGQPFRDDRFRRLHTVLSPAMLKDGDYPIENVFCKSRALKYKHLMSTDDVTQPLSSKSEVKVMVASRYLPVTLRRLSKLGEGSQMVTSE
ncbi:hypothetical protein C0Q70_00707 [Pomacea canaliculata]|uniref:Uncharacterized protein n=2 Tax=Pomacea canaliculata TaxID=400727 RepID=A0A2T7PXD9_POMCA|nr:hypothetical protein C0Q70_00707 [Pomacea canaliculata]